MPWKETDAMNQRVEFVLKALKTENFRALCHEYGISPKTGYKWKERFLEVGLSGLAEESRRPKSSPGGLSEEVVCDIIAIKEKHRYWGPKKVRRVYARKHEVVPSLSSFKRVLEKAGMTEKRRVRARQCGERIYSGRRATRPNEVWTVDFKGWWYGSDGRKREPLTVRDEASRYLLELRLVPDSSGKTVRGCFEQIFEKFGLPEAIRSDNGAPFAHALSLFGLSRLSVWWLGLGIDLERGRPSCPQDNGGHERMHRDIALELQKARMGEDQESLDVWREEFNYERPHEALGMKTPGEVYQQSERKYEGTPEVIEYPHMKSQKICQNGCIKWKNSYIFLTTAMSGTQVGLEPVEEGRWAIWYGKLRLGEMDERTESFEPADKVEVKEEKS